MRVTLTPSEAERFGLHLNRDGRAPHAPIDLLARPDVARERSTRIWPQNSRHALGDLVEQVEIDASYAVYLDRQATDVAAREARGGPDPAPDLDYRAIPGLSHGARRQARPRRPATLGQAGRIEGMTPAALDALLAAKGKRASAPPMRLRRSRGTGALGRAGPPCFT
jgi:tRNA uridine 5-carboxymethylaminomethyl modification enzyme